MSPKPTFLASLLLLVATAIPAGGPRPDPLDQWPAWHGPLATGVAPRANPPLTWAEGKNVRFKVAIPGSGHASPVVWGDRVFLATAVPFGEPEAATDSTHAHADGAHDNAAPTRRMRFVVLALDRHDGHTVWERTVKSERPHESAHVTGGWASSSPVTDGEVLIVSFGSRGIFAFDLDGKPLWQTDLGDMRTLHGHGEGSSPALHGDSVIVNWDHEGDSFVTALDRRTGKPRWKVARDEGTSWATPLVVEHGGRAQVVIAATNRVRAYDLKTGELLWQVGGLSQNVVASPVAVNGRVYVASSYDFQSMLAIRLDAAKGDLTGTAAIAWRRDRDTPYVPSPILYGDTLCFVKHLQGFFTCVDPASGRTLYGPERLAGLRMIYASPVGAADRIYLFDRGGTGLVLRKGASFELLARNQLDDAFSATPALVGDALYLRGERWLYCLAEAAAAPAPDPGP